MYKLMIMIKKSAGEDLVEHFKNSPLKHLEEASGQKMKIAEIEGAAMMEEPYEKICELTVNSKEELDRILVSPNGKKFNREMVGLMNHFALFFINYE